LNEDGEFERYESGHEDNAKNDIYLQLFRKGLDGEKTGRALYFSEKPRRQKRGLYGGLFR
jgi:hypothetical protein